jgi:hypothetical protein
MDRLFSFDLCRAELLKCARSPFLRGLFVIAMCGVTLVVALYEVDQNHGRDLRYPLSLGLSSGSLAFLGRMVPPVFFAWLFGHEASADTWKTILVRRPHRLPFLTAKAAAGAAIVVVAAVVTLLVQLAVFEATGLLAGSARLLDQAASVKAIVVNDLAYVVVATAVACAVAAAASLVARNNGTIIGFVTAYVLQVVAPALFPDTTDPVAALMFTHRATHLGSVWSGVPLHGDDVAFAAWTIAGDVVVVGGWCVLPLAVAAVVFGRRDLVSGVG